MNPITTKAVRFVAAAIISYTVNPQFLFMRHDLDRLITFELSSRSEAEVTLERFVERFVIFLSHCF